MEKVIKFLNENAICVMATCSDNNPRASAMEYIMVNGSLIFATEPDSIKAKNLSANNKISISVHNMPLCAVIEGTTETASDIETETYTKVLLERHPEFIEMLESGSMHPLHCYKLNPTVAYYNDFSNGPSPAEVIKA